MAIDWSGSEPGAEIQMLTSARPGRDWQGQGRAGRRGGKVPQGAEQQLRVLCRPAWLGACRQAWPACCRFEET